MRVDKELGKPRRGAKWLLAIAAAALLGAAIELPLWKVELAAPQYPRGLRMIAYGTEIGGDLREINIINHYVGMEHIDTAPAPEMSLFPLAMGALIALALLSPLHRRIHLLAVLCTTITPLVILVDLQRWLAKFGRNLDPSAPLRVEPFTPWVIGISKIGNFKSVAMVSWGFFAMLAAALLLYLGLRFHRSGRDHPKRVGALVPTLALLGTVILGTALLPAAARGTGTGAATRGPTHSLQTLIDSVAPNTTLRIPAGRYAGPVSIPGPLTVIGVGRPLIEGNGVGSVVTVTGEGVVLDGFAIRNSGRNVTEEAAGVKVSGSHHRITNNEIADVYFGIHLSNGSDNVVADNSVAPGKHHGARPGHAISLWNQEGSRVENNVISEARDGIYLSFADAVTVRNNRVIGCRYAVHSMYSENSTFVGNLLRDNLLGAALMYSNGLYMRCNRIEGHRRGATAYGVLLKDIDDLVLEQNLILNNRVGIYADGTPLGPGREANVRRNVLHGNDVALALQSNVGLTFIGNTVSGNLTDLRPEGKGTSSANRWSHDGRGNYWDTYQGYDRDRNGVGDLPHRYEEVMNELLERSPLARAFVYTPASLALDRAARLFPLYRPEPLLVDDAPLTRPEAEICADLDIDRSRLAPEETE